MRFYTSRTGRNLEQNPRQFQKLKFMEDEDRVFKDKMKLLQRTIPQKSDNDVDSEDEIIKLGVKFLARSFYSSLVSERESIRSLYMRRRVSAQRIRKAERKRPQRATARQAVFRTPSDRKIFVNSQNYVKTLMKQQKVNQKPSMLDSIFKSRTKLDQVSTQAQYKFGSNQKTEMKGLKRTTDTRAEAYTSGRKESLLRRNDESMNSLNSLFVFQKGNTPHN